MYYCNTLYILLQLTKGHDLSITVQFPVTQCGRLHGWGLENGTEQSVQ